MLQVMKKPTNPGWNEVVRVASPMFLVTSKHYACRYETADGESMATGYYLALWPAGGNYSSYGREVRYFGPFSTQAVAQVLQISSLTFNIVETATLATVPPAHDEGSRQPSSADVTPGTRSQAEHWGTDAPAQGYPPTDTVSVAVG